ncbi:MAG: potassium-transporting ATPase subunit C [Acidobacteriota bacterium]
MFRKDDPDCKGSVSADCVTALANGPDPDITPASAEAQAPRVVIARSVPLEKLRQLIAWQTEGREQGLLREPA